MAGPANQPSKNGLPAKSTEDIDEEKVQLAMMDDLGIARVENLPLEDEPRERGHAHRNHGPVSRGQGQPRGVAGGAGWSIDQVWKDAIESGAFEDEEARGVKDLDDLGGGRIYDKVIVQTMKILDHRNKRSNTRQSAEQQPTSKRVRLEEQTMNNSSRNKAWGHAGAPDSRDSMPSTISKWKHRQRTRAARPARSPRPPPAPYWGVPMPQMIADPNAPLPFEVQNVVFKTSALFQSRDIYPAMSSIVLLSAARRPELGLFTVVLFNRKFCEWPISAWYDYSTGADNLLGITFVDGTGSIQGYELFFGNFDSLRDFMTTVRSLKAGEFADQVESSTATSVPAQAPPSAAASNHTTSGASVMDSSIGTNGNRFTPSDSQKAQSVVPSREAGTSPTTTSGRVAAQVPSPTANDSQTANGSLAENSSSEWTGEPDQGDLINIGEAGDISTAPSRPQSESTDLLSSLEPVDPSNGAVSNAPPFEVTREEILITVRSLFTYFICSSGDFRAEALDQTAEGVRSGVLKHLLQEARAQGLSAEKIQDLEELTNSLLASVIRDHRSKTRRFRYTVEELQSMRHAALEPPGGLADIPDLPKPQKNNGQAKASAPNTPHFNQSQVSKSADAMQWVLGEASASQPIPEKESKTGAQTGESTVSGMANGAATRDLGLKSSRWATGTEEIKHANFFTGPAYEKAWSKRSHLEDLAQLDPQTRVTVGAEDLLDFYFPMSTEDNIPASSSQSRVVSNGDSQITFTESGHQSTPRRLASAAIADNADPGVGRSCNSAQGPWTRCIPPLLRRRSVQLWKL
ncbi:d490303e-7063-4d67-be6a-4c2d69ee0125 [Thermothielavioides terrestris]|uniref:D490303e-7063-4d67-be6a-4c2d69ee0125 n=1 Tax=Thermothielavioides terrestris TaxID=2587410 RepID=A0A446BEL8_9PEZI|nr:d490303e-7063-4d67-be6a-4c2d69ee0125 [Thermothielavioides terrestris]